MSFEDDCARIYDEWDQYAKNGNIPGLLSLYHEDAIFESPLVPILMNQESGAARGHQELEAFFIEGTKRRPNELVRWYRDGKFQCKDGTLFWEYPRQTLNGNQVDIAEVMDIVKGKIKHHRIYWGWFGTQTLIASEVKKALKRA